MWKQVRQTLLLGTILATAAADAQNRGASDVPFTTSINVDGSMKDLSLMHGESFEDAARSNGFLNLPDERVRQVIDQLSGILKDKMEELNTQNAAKQPPQPQTRSTQPSVQISIPLTIDNYSGELTKLEGETVDAAVERFLYATGFSMETMRNLYPQLANLLNQKLSELQPARKELFSFDLTIDGRPATVRHFEGGNPVEEAIATLRSIDISEGEMVDCLMPQLANEISRQINEVASPSQSTTATEAQNQPAASPPKELFSIPLTIDNQAVVLVHLEGATTRETAIRFLSDNGITDPEVLVTIPINLGDNRSANLECYEGDSIERTVELFLDNVGLENDGSFNDNVAQLSGLVRQRLAAMREQEQQRQQQQDALARKQKELQHQQQANAQASRPEPLLSLPVTLSNQVFTLECFESQEPAYVANTFCVEKHEIVRTELGVQFTGDQLLECKNVLVDTIMRLATQKRQQQRQLQQEQQQREQDQQARMQVQERAQSQQEEQERARATTAARGGVLFTLDIDDGEGGSLQLVFHRNDNVQDAATAFCQRHNLDKSNVPLLVNAIQANLAQR
ncbi:hypothetical protein FI667_g1120, partial [Globisporangium splendens]